MSPLRTLAPMSGQRLGAIACLAATMVSVGCSGPRTAQTPDGVGASKTEATEVVDAIVKAGFSAPHPRDTTAQDCGDIGCDQSVVTDTVTVRSFGTTGRAETYAKPLGLDQMLNLVVTFAPNVSAGEQSRYWGQIQKLAV
jgi:hypothetical protein